MITLRFSLPLLAALFVVGCGKSDEPATPLAAGPPAYVGSAACQGCHSSEFDDWMGSHHQLAMQDATADTVLGDFDNAEFDYYGTTTRFFTRGGDYFVRTADENGDDQDFKVLYTFGVEPLQQYLVEFPGGRLQTLAFTWDSRSAEDGGQRWYHQFPDEYIEPGDELHWTGPQQNWNYMCAECHSTNVVMGYDAATASFNTTYDEISVGCEGCHGPGSRHVEQAELGNGRRGLVVDLDDQGNAAWIMNTDTGIAERSEVRMRPPIQPEACGRCHARRGVITDEYEFGEPLAHTHMPALLDDPLYFADGQIRDEVYVYGSFLQSKMYQAGVSCTDCHNPHSSKLKTGANPNDVCSQCHMPTTFATPDHAGHSSEQAACVDCHMDSRLYMVVDDRRDHSFRVPRPDLSVAIGTPNACTSCHEDQDAEWAAAAVDEWRGSDAPPAHFATAFAAARDGFANRELLDVINEPTTPGIARATALSLLAQPFSEADVDSLARGLSSGDPLMRIAALRQLRSLPAEARQQLPGAALLADPVRAVRIEAVTTYAGMQDLLPVQQSRAYAAAEEDLRHASLTIANRPEALSTLGDFELAEGNPVAAIERYEQALALEPRAVAARANLADTLIGVGEIARAERILREGIAIDENAAALHHALGLLLVRGGDSDAILGELRLAAELDPGNARFAYVLGIAMNSLGSTEEALAWMTDSYSRFSSDFDIAMAVATMRRDAGDEAGAVEVADELARRFPDDPRVAGLLQSLQ